MQKQYLCGTEESNIIRIKFIAGRKENGQL